MKLITTITDRQFINSEVLSKSKPRKTVRTILFNEEGKVALLYASKYKLYSFPGGGIELNESNEEALKREVLEETGCNCELLFKLGYIYENRGQMDYTQLSYYYVTRKIGEEDRPSLTKDEEINGTTFNWYTIEEVQELLEMSEHDTMQQKFLQARDKAALKEFIKGRI